MLAFKMTENKDITLKAERLRIRLCLIMTVQLNRYKNRCIYIIGNNR